MIRPTPDCWVTSRTLAVPYRKPTAAVAKEQAQAGQTEEHRLCLGSALASPARNLKCLRQLVSRERTQRLELAVHHHSHILVVSPVHEHKANDLFRIPALVRSHKQTSQGMTDQNISSVVDHLSNWFGIGRLQKGRCEQEKEHGRQHFVFDAQVGSTFGESRFGRVTSRRCSRKSIQFRA